MFIGTPEGMPERQGGQAAATGTPHADGPRLLADIGGTNARFALESAPGVIGAIRIYSCTDFPGIVEAIQRFYADTDVDAGQPVLHAAVAIANPIDGDLVAMTNHDWRFSIEATRNALGLRTLKVVNDFAALAQAVPALDVRQRRQFGGGHAQSDGVMAVLGAGTGLGVAGLVRADARWIALSSEGGHASFSPLDAREDAILAYARAKWGHVSFERVASGPGIELIHTVLAQGRAAAQPTDTAAIVQRAAEGDALALEAIDVFCGILGSFAGNVAITFGAQGGVYVGGGVVPKLGERFYASAFRERFEQKGRFDQYLANIPTYVITADNPAFIGASEILTAALAGGGRSAAV